MKIRGQGQGQEKYPDNEKTRPLRQSIRHLSQRQEAHNCINEVFAANYSKENDDLTLSLGKDYWADKVTDLYEIIVNALIAHHKKELEDQWSDAATKLITKAAKKMLNEIRRELCRMNPDSLVRLFWILHSAIRDGNVTPDGKIIIGGEMYDIGDIIAHCCSFG